MAILESDSFTGADGAAPDAAKWDAAAFLLAKANSTNTPKISGNGLTCDTSSSTLSCGVFSVNAFDLTSGGVHVRLAYVPLDAGSTTTIALHSSSSANTPNHKILIDNSGTLYVQDSGGYSFNRAYSSVNDAYVRLQVLGGNVQAYTSPTGAPGTWVAVGASRPSLITQASAKASLSHTRWMGTALVGGPVFDNYQADTSLIADADAGVVSAGISSTVANGRIFRHSATMWSIGATGSIVETGSYTGFTPNQVRLVQDGTSTALAGFDWMAIGSASAGVYSHTFTSVPQAVGTGWYNVQVRDSAAPATIYTTGRRGVGIHVCVYGQSQATGNAVTGDSTLTPTGMSRVHGDHYSGLLSWAALQTATMNGYIAADIMLNSLTGGKVPIAFLNLGYPGTSLVSGGPNGNWLPLTNAFYQYGKNMVAGLEGKVDAVVDIRGESDANASVNQASFYAGLGTLYSTTRTDFGNANLPIIQVILGNATSYWNDAQGETIKKAQVQRCADANTYRVECYDAQLSGDGLHRSATGYATVGRRWALAVAKALGLAANYRSPRISTVSQVSGAVFDANLIYEVGSDFTPTSGITGLRVTDSVTSAVLTPTSVARQSATAIRITLGSAPANPIRLAAGYGATTTTNFASNGALPLPLEYEAGITSIQLATNATITLQSQLGVLSANLTGLKWAFFDQATPDLLGTPAAKGAVETTDASGVLVLNIAGTTLTPGAVGWLVVSDSDGTAGMTHKAFSGPVVVS